jgi:hypothetical protein
MLVRIAWILVVGAGGAAFGQPRPPDSPAVGRIAIGAIGPSTLAPDLRINLEEAVAAGLQASGAQVVTATDLAAVRTKGGMGNCSDANCEHRLAQITQTQYWLRGSCLLDVSTYRLHLELVDASTGRVRAARDDTCDICTEAEIVATANVAASALKASLGTPTRTPRATASPAQPATAAAAVDPVPANASAPVLASTPTAASTMPPLWRRLLPWGAFAAAAAASAGGIYYLSIDGRGVEPCGGTPRTCDSYNDVFWRMGVPLLAAGAALATTGIVLLALRDGTDRTQPATQQKVARAAPETTARLVISFDGVSIAGSF